MQEPLCTLLGFAEVFNNACSNSGRMRCVNLNNRARPLIQVAELRDQRVAVEATVSRFCNREQLAL